MSLCVNHSGETLTGVSERCAYIGSVVGELRSLLFDGKRRGRHLYSAMIQWRRYLFLAFPINLRFAVVLSHLIQRGDHLPILCCCTRSSKQVEWIGYYKTSIGSSMPTKSTWPNVTKRNPIPAASPTLVATPIKIFPLSSP